MTPNEMTIAANQLRIAKHREMNHLNVLIARNDFKAIPGAFNNFRNYRKSERFYAMAASRTK
jgi:hypothetical protein